MNSSFTQLIPHKHPAHGSIGGLPWGSTASQTGDHEPWTESILVSAVSAAPRALWMFWEFTVHTDLGGKKGVFWDAGRKWMLLHSGAARSSDGEVESGITISPSCSSGLHSRLLLLFLCLVPNFINFSFLVLHCPSYAHR